ncbi:MAG: YicC family protein [Burkholderiaceae bacterium]|nr:YicC family protein [Burkholderiaceae bacterium]
MTGYASGHRSTPAGQLALELRSVNSRYLDLVFRMPDELRSAEPALRELLGSRLQRGKVECRVSLRADTAVRQSGAEIDEAAFKALSDSIQRIEQRMPGLARPSVVDLLKWPGLFGEPVAIESVTPEVVSLAGELLDAFVESRVREGARLALLILERVGQIEALVAGLVERSPQLLDAYQTRLVERLEAALSASPSAAALPREETMARVRQEVVAYGLRIDVAEELDRLETHLAECRRLLAGHGPVGKRLDFLVQELNREANTLGSKAAAVDLSSSAVELKILIEQIREQLQNLE